ncbi:hypothetical protein DFS33DRAFT_52241 [Desarmillaria ectypa]|nr:hypothetical protein DFS33DRAFT_52241 [Desarmillaria ectypa]
MYQLRMNTAGMGRTGPRGSSTSSTRNHPSGGRSGGSSSLSRQAEDAQRGPRKSHRGSKSLLFSSIRALPAEILFLIFSYVWCFFEGRSEDMQILRRGMDRDALNINQTCIFYCNVCVSIPSLWTSISVNIDTTDMAACRVLSVFVRRSHERPLHVNIYHTCSPNLPKEPKDTEEICFMISASLVPQSSRIRTLKIFGCDPFFNETLNLGNLYMLGLYELAPIQCYEEFTWLGSIRNLCSLELAHYAGSKGLQCLDDEFYDSFDELFLRERTSFDAL